MVEPAHLVAFGAHPDDVEIGAGGVVAAAVRRGQPVVIVDLTRGERASAGDPDSRAREAGQAARILGVRERICLALPDTELASGPAGRRPVIEVLRRFRPALVLAPSWRDPHPDHRAAAALVRDASYLAGVRKVGGGRPWRPGALYYYLIHDLAPATVVCDITPTWEQKWSAITRYRSQFLGGSGPESTALNDGGFLDAVRARALAHGARIGVRFGEPYLCRGPVPVPELPLVPGPAAPPAPAPG